jgi:hypothetical protein
LIDEFLISPKVEEIDLSVRDADTSTIHFTVELHCEAHHKTQ